MALFTIISTIVFYVWLIIIAWLLWQGQVHTQKMQQLIIELALRAQEVAKVANEANKQLTSFLKKEE